MKTSNAPATLTAAQVLDAAVAMRPQLIEQAAETEARPFHSEDLHLQFVEDGFYHMLRPKFGGYEFSVAKFSAVIRELARGDMATAWCLYPLSLPRCSFISASARSATPSLMARTAARPGHQGHP